MTNKINFPSSIEVNKMATNSKIKVKIKNAAMKVAAKYLSDIAREIIEVAEEGKYKTKTCLSPDFTDDIHIISASADLETSAVYNATLSIILNTLKDNGYEFDASHGKSSSSGEDVLWISISWGNTMI